MPSAVNWFEIPTTDIDRATRFYEQVLATRLKRENFFGTPMAIFTAEDPGVGGALVRDDKRNPGPGGGLVYLDARGDLDGCLSRVTAAGGAVLLPRTSIGEMGAIALIADSEGNQVGLHSPA